MINSVNREHNIYLILSKTRKRCTEQNKRNKSNGRKETIYFNKKLNFFVSQLFCEAY